MITQLIFFVGLLAIIQQVSYWPERHLRTDDNHRTP